jgi:hypothetical protein
MRWRTPPQGGGTKMCGAVTTPSGARTRWDNAQPAQPHRG